MGTGLRVAPAANILNEGQALNFLIMIGTVQYWTRVGVAIATAAALSLDAFHQRVRSAHRSVFSR